MEPIVGGGRLYVATHNGNVYALDAASGSAVWRFGAGAPFLHSPALADGLLIAADADRTVYGLDAASGKVRWAFRATRGGFAASPCIADGLVFIGSRAGTFYAIDLHTGQAKWHVNLDAPIRQSAAAADGRVYVTSEDLRLHAFESASGRQLWTSAPFAGQSARGYYPVIARSVERAAVIVRTSPVLHMPDRLSRDLRVLCENAGIEAGDWKKIEAWSNSDAAMGNAELWAKEQAAILAHLQRTPDAQSAFAFDATTGQALAAPPVLWAAGCQGVPAPPIVMPNGRLFTLYRTAYGNWTHGVAAFVGLGMLDLGDNRITPIHHVQGHKPPWNTFWGTADESMNFVVAGNLALIVHQSTLSAFDFETRKLTALAGERDGFGGFNNLPWARNEWNGPARGGIAIDGDHLYWFTGSRVLCLTPGPSAGKVKDVAIDDSGARVTTAAPPAVEAQEIRAALEGAVKEFLSTPRWAPLYVQPGIGGREFFFDRSADSFEALSMARPHLHNALRGEVDRYLEAEWSAHPPVSTQGRYALKDGPRREHFAIPDEYLRSRQTPVHSFADLRACWLYATRGGGEARVRADWPRLRDAFHDFARGGWKLDPEQGDLNANRYLAAMQATADFAGRFGDAATRDEAAAMAKTTEAALVGWWQRCADRAELPVFKGVSELDRFIGKGDAIFFCVIPHRAKLALFRDMTPQISDLLRERCPGAAERIWKAFSSVAATWWLAGEERQVHYGENLFDPPDFAASAFAAEALLKRAPPAELRRRVDLPICKADLFWIAKLATALDEGAREP
jgi:hypothetical protein